MYIYWFSSESGYRRRRQRRADNATVQPIGRHIANECFMELSRIQTFRGTGD